MPSKVAKDGDPRGAVRPAQDAATPTSERPIESPLASRGGQLEAVGGRGEDVRAEQIIQPGCVETLPMSPSATLAELPLSTCDGMLCVGPRGSAAVEHNPEVSVGRHEGEVRTCQAEGARGLPGRVEADRSGLARSHSEGETPPTGPTSQGVEGSLQLLLALSEDDDIVGIEQEGDPRCVQVGTQADAGAGSANSGSNAVEEDVEQEWRQHASLSYPFGVLPGSRKTTIDAHL